MRTQRKQTDRNPRKFQSEQEISRHDLPGDKITDCMRTAAPRLQQERRKEPNECEGLYRTPHMDSATSEESSTCAVSSYASQGTEIDALQVSEYSGSTLRVRRAGFSPIQLPTEG